MTILADRNCPFTKQVLRVLGYDPFTDATVVVATNTVSGDEWFDVVLPKELCVFDTRTGLMDESGEAIRTMIRRKAYLEINREPAIRPGSSSAAQRRG